ncbi:MAG: DUF2787 family protein [Pseudomonadales bacterium]|nr:DUF2787 family protein [Pseudomonadales bacterium]
MKINTENLPYTISPKLIILLEKLTDDLDGVGITVNFRDPTYSAKFGGYHPVEIRISSNGEIEFITDFAYVGLGQDAELVKEIDFDFSCGIFGHVYCPDKPIEVGYHLYSIWEMNFLSYVEMDIFTVTISED